MRFLKGKNKWKNSTRSPWKGGPMAKEIMKEDVMREVFMATPHLLKFPLKPAKGGCSLSIAILQHGVLEHASDCIP
jgi:hypothetical protein